jgi:hypothetical protein
VFTLVHDQEIGWMSARGNAVRGVDGGLFQLGLLQHDHATSVERAAGVAPTPSDRKSDGSLSSPNPRASKATQDASAACSIKAWPSPKQTGMSHLHCLLSLRHVFHV